MRHGVPLVVAPSLSGHGARRGCSAFDRETVIPDRNNGILTKCEVDVLITQLVWGLVCIAAPFSSGT